MKPITIAPMNYRRFKYEGWLYGLAFLLAFSLRLVQLGALPLTDAEAESALQALRIAQGLKPALSPHPFYILLTAPIFFLFGGGTNFLARLLPAFVGSSLVFVPLLFQHRLKPRPSLILAFFLTFDPGLMTLSRQAASSIFTVTFFLFAWGFWINNRVQLAGAFAALALLSGPAIWPGLLAAAITWAIRQGMESRITKEERQSQEQEQGSRQSALSEYRAGVISFLVTFLLAGSLLFLVPNGLGAAFASLPAYIRGWAVPSGVSSSSIVASLLVYQPLGVLLAILAIARGWLIGSRRVIPLSLWLLVTLLLAIFYPSHQISDLMWALIPLHALAALELARYFNVQREARSEVINVILLVLFILIFAWLDLASLAWTQFGTPEATLRLGLFFGSLLLLVISIFLVAAGWSVRVAGYGAVLGLMIALGLLTFRGALGSIGLRGARFPELWWPASRPAQAGLLAQTINNISEWATGEDHALPVLILNIDSPALEWTLRRHQVTRVAAIEPGASPPIVITPVQNDQSLASSYRGQDFTWRESPAWDTAQGAGWIRWLVLREMPQNGETIILWARDDLFLDSAGQTTP